MNALPNFLNPDQMQLPGAALLLELAMRHFYAFTLVLVRMSGLMVVAPALGASAVPVNIRVLLVVTLSFVITPVLHNQSRILFDRLDRNHDGLLVREEVPPRLWDRYDRLVAQSDRGPDAPLTADDFRFDVRIPPTLIDYAWIVIGELALGVVLGLGVLIILSGLQLAGEMIDQQAGLALAEVFNPGFGANASITGTFLFLLGVTVFLVMEPIGGHLMMVSALVETFQTLPVGEAYVSAPAVELLRDLVHQSLVLAVQVAAPLLATMSLVALAMGYLGHTVPQVNVLVLGFPVRALVNLLVLLLSVSGAARAVVDVVPKVIDHLSAALV